MSCPNPSRQSVRLQTFTENCLELNFSKAPSPLFQHLGIQGQLVEEAKDFKYLGTEVDTCLSVSDKKAQQHLHLQTHLRTSSITCTSVLEYRLITESTDPPRPPQLIHVTTIG